MRKIAVFAGLLLILSTAAFGQTAAWKNQGTFIVKSSRAIPAFPRALSEYKALESNKDFLGQPFADDGSLRVFGWQGWTEIPDFPLTMNHCGEGMFMIRWRAANPNVRVTASASYGLKDAAGGKTGSYGYMYGTTCEAPRFKFTTAGKGDASNLTDIYYELKFWRAAP